jgi:uncharacterized protein YcfJ
LRQFILKTLTHVSTALFLVLLTSCKGSTFRPIVDTQGIDFNRFESDLQQCQQFSTQTNDAAASAAVGATAGAVLGSVMAGVIGGDRSATAKLIAIEGAIVGGASGETNQRNIIRR